MYEFKGKEFLIVGAAKENKRLPNIFVRSLRIHKIRLSEEERKFPLVCTLRVSQTSK